MVISGRETPANLRPFYYSIFGVKWYAFHWNENRHPKNRSQKTTRFEFYFPLTKRYYNPRVSSSPFCLLLSSCRTIREEVLFPVTKPYPLLFIYYFLQNSALFSEKVPLSPFLSYSFLLILNFGMQKMQNMRVLR